MKRREFHLGPGAASLMLVAVVLAMSLLGMLSLMNAKSDLQMARRRADVAEAAAALDAASESSFARLDALLAECADGAENHQAYLDRAAAALPEGVEMQKDLLCWEEIGADGRGMECAAKIAPLGEEIRLHWEIHRHWTDIEGDRFL